MKKRLFSFLLATTLSFSLSIPVFANSNKVYFTDAIFKTNNTIITENKKISELSLSNKVLSELLKDKAKFNFDLNILEYKDNYDTHRDIRIASESDVDFKNHKIYSKSYVKLPESLTYYNDLETKFDFYTDKENIGIKSSDLDNRMYFINRLTLENDIKNSKYLNHLDPKELNDSLEPFIKDFEIFFTGYDASSKYLLVEHYTNNIMNFVLNEIDEDQISFDGMASVDSYNGSISTKKYTLKLNNEEVTSILNKLGKFLVNDAEFNKVIDTYLQESYSDLSPENFKDLKNETMNSILNLGNYFKTESGITHSIYVSEDGNIVKQETKFTSNPFGEVYNVYFLFEQKGKENLSDELKFEVLIRDRSSSVLGLSFKTLGNLVPKQGVTDFNYKLDFVTIPSETKSRNEMEVLRGKFFLDENKNKDNISFSLNSSENISMFTVFNIDIKGDSSVDLENYNYLLNLKTIKARLDSNFINMSFATSFSKSESEVSLPKDSVKITDLSDEELIKINEYISDIFY